MTSNSEAEMENLFNFLKLKFKKVKLNKDSKRVLGVEHYPSSYILGQYDLCQAFFIQDKLLPKRLPGERKFTGIPIPTNAEQLKLQGPGTEPPCWDIVGCLRYPADHCRPDIAYAASMHGRYQQSPTIDQVNAVANTVDYMINTQFEGITVGRLGGDVKLVAFADAAFNKDADSHAQLGYCLFLDAFCGAISWKSMKDKSVSLSTTAAELNALVEVTKHIIWLRLLLEELGYPQLEPTVIFQDNANVITLCDSFAIESNSKYMINKINFIRENIRLGIIKLRFVLSEHNCSDIYTKALGPKDHYYQSLKNYFGYGYEPPENFVSRFH
jgi:hypothetical protein